MYMLILPSDSFKNVGDSRLYYDNKKMTYSKAKERCQDLGATLVEIWTEKEWKKVTHNSYNEKPQWSIILNIYSIR